MEEPARADGTTKPKPLDRPCELEFKQVRGPNGYAKSWAPEPIYNSYIPASAHIPGARFALCHPALPSVYVWLW